MAARAAALFAGLQHELAPGHAVTELFVLLARRELVERLGQARVVGSLLQGRLDLVELSLTQAAGFLEPLGALAQLLGAQRCRLDPHTIAAKAHGGALDAQHVKAHQRLVDAADLLHVEGAVAEALALEHDQPMQHGVHGAVVEARQVHRGAGFGRDDGCRAAGQVALQEGIAAGVNSLPRRGGRRSSPCSTPR